MLPWEGIGSCITWSHSHAFRKRTLNRQESLAEWGADLAGPPVPPLVFCPNPDCGLEPAHESVATWYIIPGYTGYRRAHIGPEASSNCVQCGYVLVSTKRYAPTAFQPKLAEKEVETKEDLLETEGLKRLRTVQRKSSLDSLRELTRYTTQGGERRLRLELLLEGPETKVEKYKEMVQVLLATGVSLDRIACRTKLTEKLLAEWAKP